MINGLLVVFIHPTTLISANFGYDQILKPTITNWPTQPNPWTRPVPPRSTTIPNAINELSSRRDNSLLVDVMITHFFHFLSFRLGISLLRCWWRLSFFLGATCDAHYRRLWHWTFPRCNGWLLGRLPCYWECVSGARSEQFGRCARLPWLDIRLRNVLRWFSAM